MAFSVADTVGDVIKREGPDTNDSLDKGGRTSHGISEKANPEAWKDGKVTEAEARAIYEAKYVKAPHFDTVPDAHLRSHLIDFGVVSGPMIAIQKLQDILHVKADGILGPVTLDALSQQDAVKVNNQLVAARVRLIGRIVSRTVNQVRFLNGWLDRALQFLR
jgi:lysozyme family protein